MSKLEKPKPQTLTNLLNPVVVETSTSTERGSSATAMMGAASLEDPKGQPLVVAPTDLAGVLKYMMAKELRESEEKD